MSTVAELSIDSAAFIGVLRYLPVPAAVVAGLRIVDWNPAFARLFLGESDEPVPFASFLADRNERTRKQLRALALAGPDDTDIPRTYEVFLPTAGGHDGTFELSATPVIVDEKRGLHIVLHDVTAARQSVRAAQESEARYRVLLESSSAAIALVRDGAFVFVNRGLLELFGYLLREDLVNREVSELVAGREKRRVQEFARTMPAAGGPPACLEYTGVRKDGTRLYTQVLVERVEVDDQPTALWFHVDITPWRNAAGETERRRKENDVLEHLLVALHRSVDRTEVVQGGLAASIKWLGYDAGAVLIPAADGKTYFIDAQQELSDRLQEFLRELPADQGLVGFLVKTMEPARFSLAEYPPHLPYKALFESEGFCALACMPLAGREATRGVVLLFSRRETEPPENHTAFLAVVARHFGLALESAVLREEVNTRALAYQASVENLNAVVYRTSANGTFEYCSPVVERLSGYKIRELTASSDGWRAMVHPDDRPVYGERITRQSGGENEFVLEYRILPKGKASYLWVRDTVRYRRDVQNLVMAVHGVVTEVTGGKNAEIELRRSGEMLRSIVDAMGDALFVTDLEGRILEVNRALSTLTGYTRGEVLGMGLPYPWMVEEEMGNFMQWLATLREERHQTDFNMTWSRRDGHSVPIRLNTTLLKSGAGDPVAILNLARDIGARKRLGEEVEQQNRELTILHEIGKGLTGALDTDTLFSLVCDGVSRAVAFDLIVYETYVATSGALARIFAAEPTARPATGEPVTGVSSDPPGNASAADPRSGESVIAGDTEHLVRVAREQESYHGPAPGWGVVLAAPVIADGTTVGVLWMARHSPKPFPETDLRLFLSIANLVAIALDRVSLHDDAVRQARELEARNGELDRFAYVVSHDLKEPLIAIEGYTKIVLSGKTNVLDEEGRHHLGSVVRSSERMKQLIDDLLTLSRLDRVSVRLSAVDVPLLLGELLHEMAFTLMERNARVEYGPDLPAVRYDATHLGMVFRNLISNGVKFNSSAKPLVRITAEENPDGIVYSVSDNGIGIPAEEAEKIFVIFHRLHPVDRYAGTGAGLTIVKKIVEAYGGRIWLESSPDQGSTFHFGVPHHV